MTTSVSPLREVLYHTLRDDTALKTALGVSVSKPIAVFRGIAGSGVAKPYISIGSLTEDPLGTFGKGHNSGTDTLHIWSADASDVEALAIYVHVERLLSGVQLTVPGFPVVSGVTRIIFCTQVSERGETSTHCVVEYASLRVAA